LKFLVLSRQEIELYKPPNKKHIVISIADPEAKTYAKIPNSNFRLGVLQLRFPDFDREWEGYKYNYLVFNQQFAKEILAFVNYWKYTTQLIICQCEAGISRSAGVAGALAKILNGDDNYFFKHYLPNKLVYNTILKEANKCEP